MSSKTIVISIEIIYYIYDHHDLIDLNRQTSIENKWLIRTHSASLILLSTPKVTFSREERKKKYTIAPLLGLTTSRRFAQPEKYRMS
jgi:hypothetical protein